MFGTITLGQATLTKNLTLVFLVVLFYKEVSFS